MLFSHTPRYRRWFGSYKYSKKMVDCQLNLDWWLESASLFPNEPVNDFFNFDELEPNVKSNNEVNQVFAGLSDLNWLDEKVDLSVFDIPSNLLIHTNEAETSMLNETATLLDGLVGSNFDTSYLPSYVENDSTVSTDKLQPITEADSVPVSSPKSSVEENLISPTSSVENIPNSPVSCVSSASIADSSDFSPLPVYVTIYESEEDPKKSSDVGKSVKKRKYTRNERKISSDHSSVEQLFHPYASERLGNPKSRYLRKKEQNKVAAARYRSKKRLEEQGLSDEVSVLESEQKDLKEKHDQLQNEIKYLKSLMREMFKAKGLL